MQNQSLSKKKVRRSVSLIGGTVLINNSTTKKKNHNSWLIKDGFGQKILKQNYPIIKQHVYKACLKNMFILSCFAAATSYKK